MGTGILGNILCQFGDGGDRSDDGTLPYRIGTSLGVCGTGWIGDRSGRSIIPGMLSGRLAGFISMCRLFGLL